MTKKQYVYFISAFLILLIGRLLIAGQGYLEDNDELLYIYIVLHYKALLHFDIHPWVQAIFDMGGQPPEIAVRLFESLFAYTFSSATGIPMLHPDSLFIIGLFNILVSLLISLIYFRILVRIGFSFGLALTGVILLGTLVNANIYTRHFLPYDSAVLFQLIALYILVGTDLSFIQIFIAGLWSAIGLTDYFGGFMFVFINAGFLLLYHTRSIRDFFQKLLLFFSPFLILVSVYEIVTRSVSGQSYLGFVLEYADTITQASFSEGLYYVFLYFGLVERGWGLAVLVLFFIGLYMSYRAIDTRQVRTLLLLAVMAYLIYGSYVYFIQKMVFFGRVLEIYYPFIIIGVLYFVQQQRFMARHKILALITICAMINYGFVIQSLNSICYPRGLIYQYRLFGGSKNIKFNYDQELFSGQNYKDRSLWYIDSIGSTGLRDGSYSLVNICFFKHHPDDFIETYKKYTISSADTVLFEKTHFQSYPAYTLEYCDRDGRNFFLDKQFKIRIIKNSTR